MRCLLLPSISLSLLTTMFAFAAEEPTVKPIVHDDFNRAEVGKNWSTNDGRAQRTSGVPKEKFVSQSQIENGVLQIRRTKGSDHGASVKTPAEFTNGEIKLRFRLTGENKFSVNMNDPELKTVHAGHICKVEIAPNSVMVQDQKTGTMNLKIREQRLENKLTAETKKMLATKQKKFPAKVAAGDWHNLFIRVQGETISVTIDEVSIGEFSSDGLAHSPKRNIAFAVNVAVDVDDVTVVKKP